MEAGRLRHRLILQEQVKTQSPTSGAEAVTWTEKAKVWAEIAPLSAKDFVSAQSEQSEVTARITIRYRNDIDATMRLFHQKKGIYYHIVGVLSDKDSGLEYMTLPCSEGVRE